jgi:hypothetical protein
MSIRETINEKPGIGAALAGAMLVVGVIVAYRYHVNHPSELSRIGTTFYSEDDGQSYYRDSLYRFPPYSDGDKTAVMAVVFSDGQQNFVGLLQRYTPDAQKRLADEYAKVQGGSEPLAQLYALMGSPEIRNSGTELKLPGAGNQWVLRSSNPQLKLKSPSGGPCWVVTP